MKIGETYEAQKDLELQTLVTGREMTIKKGDMGVVTKNGHILMLTGKCKGKKILKIDITLKDIDFKNISNITLKRLDSEFNLNEILEDNDIEPEHVAQYILDTLEQILL